MLLLFIWASPAIWSYLLFYYEAANGAHLEKLRRHGPLPWLLVKGVCWSLLSQLLLLGLYLSALRRKFWRFPSNSAARPPVVFVHGLYHNHTAWCLYLYWFRRWGLSHLKAVRLPGKFRSIREHTRTLAEEIEQVLHLSGSEQVDLVGHSMGGLVIRSYLKEKPESSRVRRVVTLATPHAGSKMAVFAVGAPAKEMLPGSKFLQSLNGAGFQVPPGGSLYTVYTDLDNMVLPNESARGWGEKVTCLATRPLNHVGLLFCRQTAKLVKNCLEGNL